MSKENDENMFYCSFVSIHYIICECGETFPSEEELKDHLQREHSTKSERKEYKCGVCEAIFPTEQACIEHYDINHIEVKIEHEHDYVETSDYIETTDYTEPTEDYVETTEDYNETTEDYNETTEDYNETTEDYVETVNYIEEGDYVEGDDYITTTVVDSVENDIKVEPGRGRPRVSQIYTPDLVPDNSRVQIKVEQEHDYLEAACFEEYEGDIQEYTVQLSTQDPETLQFKPPRKQKPKKPKSYYNMKNIVCEVCGKQYASNAALRYHQRVHTGERPYKCTLCPKTFTMPLFLQIHIRTHTGERPYQCQLCTKAFSNKAALLRHDRVHTGVKPYECPQCGKFFTQSNSMKLHVNTVHLKQPAPYKSKARRSRLRERQMHRENETVETIIPEQEVPAGVEVKQELDALYAHAHSEGVTYELVYQE